MMPRNKLGFDRQLGGRQAQRFARFHFRDAVHFNQNVRRTNDRHPAFQGRLALAHACFERLLRVGFLREDADPHLALALHVAGHRHTRGLKLLRVHPPAPIPSNTNRSAPCSAATYPARPARRSSPASRPTPMPPAWPPIWPMPARPLSICAPRPARKPPRAARPSVSTSAACPISLKPSIS